MAGQDWNKEVGTWKGEKQAPAEHVTHDLRTKFYMDRVKLKLKDEFTTIVNDLSGKGFKTLEEHKGKNFEHTVAAGNTLFGILKNYYQSVHGLDATKAEQESYLSLAHIMRSSADQKGNVDDLEIGNRVMIADGHMTIFTKLNAIALNSVALRPAAGAVIPPMPAPAPAPAPAPKPAPAPAPRPAPVAPEPAPVVPAPAPAPEPAPEAPDSELPEHIQETLRNWNTKHADVPVKSIIFAAGETYNFEDFASRDWENYSASIMKGSGIDTKNYDFVVAPNLDWNRDDFVYEANGKKYLVVNPNLGSKTAKEGLQAALTKL